MIIITGAAGFIGSAYLWHLNEMGVGPIILCDRFKTGEKWRNVRDLRYADFIFPEKLLGFAKKHAKEIKAVIHMGACSATTETDMDFLWTNNFKFTKALWKLSVKHDWTFIYASSAATYGDGNEGYLDEEKNASKLKPLNKYGYSKQLFDLWALSQTERPSRWAGLKFFNVYGPNEYHKGSMASVIFHNYHQFKQTGKVRLFKSHRDGYADGEQKRDFVYVKDVVNMIDFFRTQKSKTDISGIYNVASGKARSFNDFVNAMFLALATPKASQQIEYFDMPEQLRGKYQYFTEGNLSKIKKAGYAMPSHTLEEGVKDYVLGYLSKEEPHFKTTKP
jgi:ADP-L-glycero-D-manno-heptose 6-epimerase